MHGYMGLVAEYIPIPGLRGSGYTVRLSLKGTKRNRKQKTSHLEVPCVLGEDHLQKRVLETMYLDAFWKSIYTYVLSA